MCKEINCTTDWYNIETLDEFFYELLLKLSLLCFFAGKFLPNFKLYNCNLRNITGISPDIKNLLH